MRHYINSMKYRLWCLYFAVCNLLSFKHGATIVIFHHVRDDEALDVIESCKCTICEFKTFVNYVSKHKQVVSLSELLSKENRNYVDKVVITFDDVPDNFYKNAYPILKDARLPFTLYITSNLIGTEGFLTKEQLVELSKDKLCTIGSHTKNHVFLSAKGIDLEDEIKKCKVDIEKTLGISVNHFAYPYGTPTAVNRKARRFTERSGVYKSAVSTIPSMINRYSIKTRYFLPRIYHKLYMNINKY